MNEKPKKSNNPNESGSEPWTDERLRDRYPYWYNPQDGRTIHLIPGYDARLDPELRRIRVQEMRKWEEWMAGKQDEWMTETAGKFANPKPYGVSLSESMSMNSRPLPDAKPSTQKTPTPKPTEGRPHRVDASYTPLDFTVSDQGYWQQHTPTLRGHSGQWGGKPPIGDAPPIPTPQIQEPELPQPHTPPHPAESSKTTPDDIAAAKEAQGVFSIPEVVVFNDDAALEAELDNYLYDKLNKQDLDYPVLFALSKQIINRGIKDESGRFATDDTQCEQVVEHLANRYGIDRKEVAADVNTVRTVAHTAIGVFRARARAPELVRARRAAYELPKPPKALEKQAMLEGIDAMKVDAVTWYYTKLHGEIRDPSTLTPEEFDRLAQQWSELKNISTELIRIGAPVGAALAVGTLTGGTGVGALWHTLLTAGAGLGAAFATDRWNKMGESGSRAYDLQLLGAIGKLDKNLRDGAYHEVPARKIQQIIKDLWRGTPAGHSTRREQLTQAHLRKILEDNVNKTANEQRRVRMALIVAGGVYTLYQHLGALTPTVAPSQPVPSGETIGDSLRQLWGHATRIDTHHLSHIYDPNCCLRPFGSPGSWPPPVHGGWATPDMGHWGWGHYNN